MAQRVTDPSSLYSKMTPKASSTSAGSNFVDLTLGRSSDAVTIKTLAAPPIDARSIHPFFSTFARCFPIFHLPKWQVDGLVEPNYQHRHIP